ncbi:MAG TPA: glutathione S-transferase family protein [Pseudomonadales bacterium]|nr:glutathione S-transferase family protein [Pseudomonadales bacterium]
MRVHGDPISGNCYKVKLLLELLGEAYDWVQVDVVAGEARLPAFRALNANASVPILELDDGTVLAESNAILFYLAEGSAFLPADRLQRAQVLQWQCFEQYSHEPYIAVNRFIRHFQGMPQARRAEFEGKVAGGYRALDVMERHLAERAFFVGDGLTIADISLYAYTHVADEGGFDLSAHPAVGRWLARVAAWPGHVPMA